MMHDLKLFVGMVVILSPLFLFHAVSGEVRSVQDVHAPFDHLDDGDPYGGGENKKQNELDDHFSYP
jgi:hypothetical protein